MALFRSRQQQDIEAVAEKLAAERQNVEVAEQRLKDAALAAALSPDPWAAEPHHEALRRARERVELLENALEHAEALERQRQAQRQAELRATQNRAIAQHRGRLGKAARDYEKYTAWQVEAFDRMIAEGEAIKRLLPPDFGDFARAVSYPALRAACETEMHRVGMGNPADPNARPSAPGTSFRSTFHPLLTPPLADDLEARLLRLYNVLVGKAPPPIEPPEAAPEPIPEPPVAPPSADVEPAAQGTAAPAIDDDLPAPEPVDPVLESARAWIRNRGAAPAITGDDTLSAEPGPETIEDGPPPKSLARGVAAALRRKSPLEA